MTERGKREKDERYRETVRGREGGREREGERGRKTEGER